MWSPTKKAKYGVGKFYEPTSSSNFQEEEQ